MNKNWQQRVRAENEFGQKYNTDENRLQLANTDDDRVACIKNKSEDEIMNDMKGVERILSVSKSYED